jgi:chromosome segregation ATPase
LQDAFQTLSQQSNHNDQERLQLDNEIQHRQQQQIEWDQTVTSLNDDMNINNENIRTKQSTIDCIQNELKQKEQDFDELKKIDKDKTNVYGNWMSDCLKAIENENRFHKKPIGPLGRYIRCTDSRWSYAVEKHLAPIMSSFICTDVHDERILLELFDYYCRRYRPTIFVMKFSNQVHDVSGTLERIRRANLLSIYQVLKIDNITVECALIDFKQIEATILVEDLQEAKQIRQSGILRWDRIDKKVKQVSEAWAYDGSNIKLDKAFRIYTNDKQAARYFTSNNAQSLSTEELQVDIKRLNEQIKQMKESINELKLIRQTTTDSIENVKKATHDNNKKTKELAKVILSLSI